MYLTKDNRTNKNSTSTLISLLTCSRYSKLKILVIPVSCTYNKSEMLLKCKICEFEQKYVIIHIIRRAIIF